MHPSLFKIITESCQPMCPTPTALEPQRVPMQGLQVVLFDVYGTLFCSGTGDLGISTAQHNAEAMQNALAQSGGLADVDAHAQIGRFTELIAQEHTRIKAQGIEQPEVDIRDIWQALLSPNTDPSRPELAPKQDMIERIALRYECAVNPVWPLPGLEACLEQISERGLRLGIVSNAQFYTPLLFEALLGKSVSELGFEAQLCAWSYALGMAKPTRAMFSGLLTQLAQEGIAPDEVLYIGNDMLNDIWTAQQSGCRTALFAGDARSLRLRESEPRCAGLKPDAIITELSQVPELLAMG